MCFLKKNGYTVMVALQTQTCSCIQIKMFKGMYIHSKKTLKHSELVGPYPYFPYILRQMWLFLQL